MAGLDWARQGGDWPHRDTSRFVEASGLRWHIQEMGEINAPPLLLLHGTGASTHSWRDFLPHLAADFRVLAPDLPGHGFTALPPTRRLSLKGMADAVDGLLRSLDLKPAVVVGHSAGAAIALEMTLAGMILPRLIVSLNGALLPARGLPGPIFSPLARLFSTTSLVPRIFAWRAGDRRTVEKLLRGTGSAIDRRGVDLYQRLFASPSHCAAALGMMAQWDLWPLEEALPRLKVPLLLVAGGRDRAIPPAQAWRVRERVPEAEVAALPGLGHLAHEEQPGEVAGLILEKARAIGILPGPQIPSTINPSPE